MDGQMSIFDFPEWLPEEPKEEIRFPKISQTTAIYYTELLRGSGFENGKTRIYSFFQQEKNSKKRVEFLKKEYGEGGRARKDYTANHDTNGIDIEYKNTINKCTASHYGWPMVEKAIQELITLGVYMDDDFEVPWVSNEELMGIPKQIKEKVCCHSNHTCNKEELWKIAAEDDPFCPRVCCRFCNTKMCGARCNGSEEPEKTREWIGDDYLEYIMKALLNKYGSLIGEIKNYSFEKSKDWIKPLTDTVFKKHREMPFFVENDMYCLRWPNDGTDGSVLSIKRDKTTVANILTREIIEDIQERYDPKLDIPMVPIYHESLSHVWEECPNCKGQNRLSTTKSGSSGNYYTEYSDRCPDCGQKLLWDWDEIDKKAKKSADVKACEFAGLSGAVNEEDLKKAREQYAKRGN